jgi:hypothetical protein
MKETVNASEHPNGAYSFLLYFAGGAPNYVRALADAILVTPTVVKLSPAPELQIIGDLSEKEEVLRALGLP